MTDKIREALEACREFIEGMRKPRAYGAHTISSYEPCGVLIDKIDAALASERKPNGCVRPDEPADGYNYCDRCGARNDGPCASAALAKAIEGMEELPEIDNNPPLNFIPQTVKEKLYG